MLANAIIEKGQIRLLEPITFIHEQVIVKIDIPDAAIISSSINQQLPSAKLLKILGEGFQDVTIDQNDYYNYLEAKYQ